MAEGNDQMKMTLSILVTFVSDLQLITLYLGQIVVRSYLLGQSVMKPSMPPIVPTELQLTTASDNLLESILEVQAVPMFVIVAADQHGDTGDILGSQDGDATMFVLELFSVAA